MAKGYRAVSTREIAKACQITQPALYYHFPDKESLYIAMIEKHVQRIKARLALSSDLTLPERLEQMFIILSEDHPSSIMLMIHDIRTELKPDNQRHVFLLWKESYLQPFEQIFTELQGQGRLRPSVTPEDAARFCLLTLGQKISSGQSNSLSGRYHVLVDLILNGTLQA